MTDVELIKVSDAQKILNVSQVVMYQLIHSEGFPVVRIGKGYRINRAKLQKWIENGGKAIECN